MIKPPPRRGSSPWQRRFVGNHFKLIPHIALAPIRDRHAFRLGPRIGHSGERRDRREHFVHRTDAEPRVERVVDSFLAIPLAPGEREE